MRRGVTTAATAAIALFALPRLASAFCRTTTGDLQPDPTHCSTSGVPIAWRSSCASLSVDPRVLPDGISRDEFRAEVSAASARWSTVDCGGGTAPNFHFVAYTDCPHNGEWNPHGANANTVSFRPVWPSDSYHPALAIAITITTFTRDQGEILDADTELNLRSATNPNGFVFALSTPSSSMVDLPTVLTHEQGHAQGLAHSPDGAAVMWYAAGLGEERRVLTPDDIAGICTIYPSTRNAACAPDPPGGFECATGCHCGAAVRRRTTPGWAFATLACATGCLRRRRRVANATRSVRSQPRP